MNKCRTFRNKILKRNGQARRRRKSVNRTSSEQCGPNARGHESRCRQIFSFAIACYTCGKLNCSTTSHTLIMLHHQQLDLKLLVIFVWLSSLLFWHIVFRFKYSLFSILSALSPVLNKNSTNYNHKISSKLRARSCKQKRKRSRRTFSVKLQLKLISKYDIEIQSNKSCEKNFSSLIFFQITYLEMKSKLTWIL